MFARRARLLWLLLVVSDVLPLFLSFEIAYLVRAHFPELPLFFLTSGEAAGLLITAAVLWTLLGVGMAVYRRPQSFETARLACRTAPLGLKVRYPTGADS